MIVKDKGLLVYPEVIKSLSVLPKNSYSDENKLAVFKMYKLP